MTIWSADKYFKNAKACFAENLERLPQPNPLAPITGVEALMWNLSRGLHDLTAAVEINMADLHSRISALEKALPRDK